MARIVLIVTSSSISIPNVINLLSTVVILTIVIYLLSFQFDILVKSNHSVAGMVLSNFESLRMVGLSRRSVLQYRHSRPGLEIFEWCEVWKRLETY